MSTLLRGYNPTILLDEFYFVPLQEGTYTICMYGSGFQITGFFDQGITLFDNSGLPRFQNFVEAGIDYFRLNFSFYVAADQIDIGSTFAYYSYVKVLLQPYRYNLTISYFSPDK